jgi:hypothetical protein
VKTWFKIATKLEVKEKNSFIAHLKKVDPRFRDIYMESEDIPILRLLIEFSTIGLLIEAENLSP